MTVTINGNGTITGLTTVSAPQVNATTKLIAGAPTTTNFTQKLQSISSTGETNAMFFKTVANATGPDITLAKSRNGLSDPTAFTAVIQNDTLGTFQFGGTDGSALVTNGVVSGYVDGVVITGTIPTALTFATGTTSATQRVVITSAGLMGIGTGTPASSAIVDVTSTTLGFKFPVMTTTQKNAIVSPVAGLVIFDSTLAKLCVYSGSAWQTITST